MEKHIKNISEMEEILDHASSLVAELADSVAKINEYKNELHRLFRYYGSEEWFADRERDERGEIPSTLPRGVLTEDAVYDLLMDYTYLMRDMKSTADGELYAIEHFQD